MKPHLTLLSGLEAGGLVDRTRLLATQIAPFEVRLSQASWGVRWFQCVYLLAEFAPPLLVARRADCATLGGSPSSTLLPHISLLYGGQSAQTRAEICHSLKAIPHDFGARELVLVNTVGPAERGSDLARCPLAGAA